MTSKNIVTKDFHSSSSSAIYTAQYDTVTGESSCNCKGWTFKRGNAPRTCKHTREMEAAYGVGATPIKAKKPVRKVTTASSTDTFMEALKEHMGGTYAVENDDVSVGNDGIVETIKAPVPVGPTPMLASAMREGLNLDYFIKNSNVFRLEEKLDGHRLLITVQNGEATAMARPRLNNEANSRDLPQHILDGFRDFPNGIYDGELYLPGGTSTDVVRLDKQDELMFGIFDLIELTGASLISKTYLKRREQLEEIFFVFDIDRSCGIHMIENLPLTKETIDEIWRRGGEGAIIKHIDSTYKFGARTPEWIKVKKLESATLKITGFQAGKVGPNSVAELEDSNGLKTTIKVLNNEILAEIDKNPKKYIGKELVISYMGKAANGGFRHATWDHIL